MYRNVNGEKNALKTLGTVAYMILMVFYGVYTMVLAIIAYVKFSNAAASFLNITSNLSQQFVIDVQTSTTNCPSGYNTIFDWDWLGSEEGCDCSKSTYASHRSVYTSTCNSTEISKGCYNVQAEPAVFFNAIEGTTNSKELVCIKRGMDSFSNIAAQQTGVCTSSQKTCGNPSKVGTVICVGLNDNCPIYDIMMSTSVDLATYPASDWRQINLASGNYLYVNTKGTASQSLPLSEFRFTQVSVCKDENTAKQKPADAYEYTLVETTRNACTESDDTFIESKLQVAENKYYAVNVPSAQWERMKKWSNYRVLNSTEPFKSYKRPFINWNVAYRSSIKDLVDSTESVKDVQTAQLTVMFINIIVCLLVSIALQISEVYNLFGQDVPCIPGIGSEEKFYIVTLKKGLAYGGKLLQGPFLLWAFILSNQKKDMLNSISSSNPSDPRFNSEMSIFSDQIENEVYKRNLNQLITLLSTVLVDILIFLRVYISRRMETKRAQQRIHAQKQEEEAEKHLTQGVQSNTELANQNKIAQSSDQQESLFEQDNQSVGAKQAINQNQEVDNQPVIVVTQLPIQPVIIVQPVIVQPALPTEQPTVIVQDSLF